jgi:dTDP-4-dehydrorhamnose reductase
LITGGSGLLALNWAITRRSVEAIVLAVHTRQVALDGVRVMPLRLDSLAEVLKGLDAVRPQLVAHTAGLTSVEACEGDPTRARHVNVELAETVAAAAAARDVPLVHISTDHAVGGHRPLVDETVPLDPQNVYAQTKAEAEQRVLSVHPDALVVRTNFYGWGPTYRQSFSEGMVRSLREGRRLTLFTDVFYTPILAETLVDTVCDLVRLRVGGIVNVVGDERISKHDFGHRVARHFGLNADLISEGLLSDHPNLVRRPLDMSLSNAKVCRVLGRSLGGVDTNLARLRQLEGLAQVKELQNL